jgi:transcriptional regulator with XRE-family HTH domain
MTTQTVGTLLRAFRSARGKSQLALALEAGVSTRHLSFVETGRSMPSRELVMTLAQTLDVPLRDRNALLEAAGYAAIYRETPLDAPSMSEVRSALEHMLAANEPNPTLIVNRRYDVLMVNQGARAFFRAFDYRGPMNVVRAILAKEGLRPWIRNFAEVASYVVHRTRAELSVPRDDEDRALLAELQIAAEKLRSHERPSSVLLPLKMARGALELDLYTTIATLGTPLDITLQELRIETLFPADARSRERLAHL